MRAARGAGPPPVTRAALATVVALAAVGGVLAVPACDRGSATEGFAAPELATVERRDLEVRAEASGTVEPVRVVEVKSKASGEVLRLHVETGDAVAEGALLAEIDPRDVRNGLAQAEADLEVARAQLVTAQAQRQRTEALQRSRVATEQELESASLVEAEARAQLVKARTNLELARERMGDVTIRAPIAGTVIQKDVEEGQIIASASANVSGGTTLLLMADLGEMQVRALVDETDIGRIRPGQPARVVVDAFAGRAFEGSVLKIEPQAVVDQNVTMFPVLIGLDNREGLLKPGMNAEVEVAVARREDAVVVPNTAVTTPREAAGAAALLGVDPAAVRQALRGAAPGASSGGAGVVFLSTAAGPEPRGVQLGLSDWDYTEVTRGLEPGERVVQLSAARLQQERQEREARLRERVGSPFGGSSGTSAGASGGARPGGQGGGGGTRP